MNTSFERSEKATDEWYTPKGLINSILSGGGKFDLDPCAPVNRLWDTALKHYTKEDDGLSKDWEGRVWLNPPYSRPLIEQFVHKMVQHNNGIMLLFNRCDSKMFQEEIFPHAKAMIFLRKRIRFFRPDGTQGNSPGCGSVLIAFGADNAELLKKCGLEGKYVELNE